MTSTSSRLLSGFTITTGVNDVLMVDDGGVHTVTISPGTYAWTCDNAVTGLLDFAKELDTQLEAMAAGLWGVTVVGVTTVSGTHADGRVLYGSQSGSATFLFTHASTTLDPQIMGWDGTADIVVGVSIYSPMVHLYGWYPQRGCEADLPVTRAQVDAGMTTGRYLDVIDDGEYGAIDLTWLGVPACVVRIAGSDTNRATPWYITVGDLNCSLERFVLNCARFNLRWYYYPQTSTTGTRHGPYALTLGAQYGNPLANSSPSHRAGELWTVTLRGEEVAN